MAQAAWGDGGVTIPGGMVNRVDVALGEMWLLGMAVNGLMLGLGNLRGLFQSL